MSSSFSRATSLFAQAGRSSLRAPQASGSLLARRGVLATARCYSVEADKPASASGSDASPPPAGEANDLSAKLKAKDEEVADLTSRLRYAQADFINLQKISAREKDQTSLYAITGFARDLITTVDVLSLALKSVPETALSSVSTSSNAQASTLLKQLHEGVSMTHRQLLQTLAKFGVTPFDPMGEKFDPNLHEALYEAPIPGKEPGTVIDCQKVGYKIKDRVLRAAQVGVVREA